MAQTTLNTLAAGSKFTYGGNEWIVLEQQDGRAVCLSADIIGNKAFDNDGNNNWAESSLRKYLNGTYIKKLISAGADKEAFLEFITDLTADDGMPNYGESTDKISLLTCDHYRKYRRAGVLKVISRWWWMATAWTASSSRSVRYVGESGALSGSSAIDVSYGVRPLCNLLSSILVSAEGAEAESWRTPKMREILFQGFHPCEDGEQTIQLDGEIIWGDWKEGFYAEDDKTLDPITVLGEALGKIKTVYREKEYVPCIISKEGYWWDVVPQTVRQFTGLTDKKGKKIFEGDKVKLTKKSQTIKGDMVFSGSRFVLLSKGIGYNLDIEDLITDNKIEVIGTIYDTEGENE